MRGRRFGSEVWALALVGWGVGCGGSALPGGPLPDGGTGTPSLDAMVPDSARDHSDGSPALHLDAAGSSSDSSSGGQTSGATSGKVDLLIDIDNSASMGDKQAFLKAAIPDLINGLINPSCVDPSTKAVLGVSSGGQCAQGVLEFAPVRDMHIALITSSLGPRGGDACNPTAMAPAPYNNVSAHNDDQAHLINRSLTYGAGSVVEGVVGDAAPAPADEFLYWFPGGQDGGASSGSGTALSSAAQVNADLAELVGGAGVFGCGLESQLESWYRFLVQPDPYASIVVSNAKAAWSGVDTTILQQRHDFLRPDSLVSIIVLSDENDSEIDVRSIGGQGYNWNSTAFTPPKSTSACATNPASMACQSCAQGTNATTDPACHSTTGGAFASYTAANDWGYDLNLRHVHMKAKYGVDPQYPIQRYVNGLTSTTVPDRSGEYPAGAGSYVGANDCTNPLFAASLPDGTTTDVTSLCHLSVGTRPPGFVFFTHIGGVPSQLLHYTPGDAQASALTDADWKKILGNDPLNYDYSGIDPHMIESYQPRAGLAPPGSPNGADPINGHEWVTDSGQGHILQVDREYACIFPLVGASGAPASRDCTLQQNANFCDCPHTAGSVTAAQLPPICDSTTPTLQTGAKAYPTIRELLLAKLMGSQGIVSSICPQHVVESTPGDPLWGYRPAIGILISRLAPVIARPQ